VSFVSPEFSKFPSRRYVSGSPLDPCSCYIVPWHAGTVTPILTDVCWYTVCTVVCDLTFSLRFCTRLRLEGGDCRNPRNVGNSLRVPTAHYVSFVYMKLC